eukprot:scaffold253089_cov31-Tisochrysis_lutea.AAC.2
MLYDDNDNTFPKPLFGGSMLLAALQDFLASHLSVTICVHSQPVPQPLSPKATKRTRHTSNCDTERAGLFRPSWRSRCTLTRMRPWEHGHQAQTRQR